jgi:predicted MFS family arabinose efflux permease
MAFGTGICAATIYLSQPLLEVLRDQFNASLSQAGSIVTLTQIGYALGLFFLVPLGDVVNKKHLIQIKLILITLILILTGLAQSISLFLIASLLLGIVASAAQDFVPLAADLAPESERGHVVGTVMSGLLLGILLSRTFSGITAHHFGWRSVFFICAGIIVLILILTTIMVPSHPPKIKLKYTKLMHSMGQIFLENPLLQLSTLTQGLVGIAFSAFWTVLTFELSGAPFGLSTATIGLFGLAGAAGAIAAPISGKISDRIGPLFNIKFGIVFIFLSFMLMYFFQNIVLIIIIGALFFDLGVQVCLISHQSIIYAMHPEARSRINSLFVTGLFIFFSIGSYLGSLIYADHGWSGVLLLSLVCCIAALLSHLLLAHKYNAVFAHKTIT